MSFHPLPTGEFERIARCEPVGGAPHPRRNTTKGSDMSGFTTDIYPRVIVDDNGHHDFQTLSPRELDVLQALVDGKGSVEGAASLYISRHTFRTHVKSIYRKTGTHSAIEAVSMGVSLGMRPTRLSAAA
ncbi:MAG: LuxR family transcriptional regulator [Actinobacteria bacterium]|nr:LuxR family transcriptional regulator [Actinomycetota bacterium]